MNAQTCGACGFLNTNHTSQHDDIRQRGFTRLFLDFLQNRQSTNGCGVHIPVALRH
ncbi:Uncharacterised protein [Shigella sonnei]|nr:Uncharacterised protein [Shigella sonnei]CSS14320.1 Uncharacterised protein [Shigella sonnei]